MGSGVVLNKIVGHVYAVIGFVGSKTIQMHVDIQFIFKLTIFSD